MDKKEKERQIKEVLKDKPSLDCLAFAVEIMGLAILNVKNKKQRKHYTEQKQIAEECIKRLEGVKNG